jgi:hypothetical protein
VLQRGNGTEELPIGLIGCKQVPAFLGRKTCSLSGESGLRQPACGSERAAKLGVSHRFTLTRSTCPIRLARQQICLTARRRLCRWLRSFAQAPLQDISIVRPINRGVPDDTPSAQWPGAISLGVEAGADLKGPHQPSQLIRSHAGVTAASRIRSPFPYTIRWLPKLKCVGSWSQVAAGGKIVPIGSERAAMRCALGPPGGPVIAATATMVSRVGSNIPWISGRARIGAISAWRLC